MSRPALCRLAALAYQYTSAQALSGTVSPHTSSYRASATACSS